MLNFAVGDEVDSTDKVSTSKKHENNHPQKKKEETPSTSLNVDDVDTVALEEALLPSNTTNNDNKKGCVKRIMSHCLNIFTDQSGSAGNICQGMSLMVIMGVILGLIMPKNNDLRTPSYRIISSMIGYTYFVCWSVSLYPQIITNYQRKSVEGLSIDAQVMAFLNYGCYAIYNAEFFWNPIIRKEYQDQHDGAQITVQSNDVAFSLHALVMTLVVLIQIVCYGNKNILSSLSRVTLMLIGGVSTILVLYVVGILLHTPQECSWIDFLYILAFIKLAFTICFYIPQLLLNIQRQSTDGFNIWSILLDFSGGLLSLLQIVLDSIDMHNLSGGISGNWAKFLLGFLTLFFDSCFFLQHYVLYRQSGTTTATTSNNGEKKSMSLLFEEFYHNQELV